MYIITLIILGNNIKPFSIMVPKSGMFYFTVPAKDKHQYQLKLEVI